VARKRTEASKDANKVFAKFTPEVRELCEKAIAIHDVDLTDEFILLIEYCFKNKDEAGSIGKTTRFTEKWLNSIARSFSKERTLTPPGLTKNISDPLIREIAKKYFTIRPSDLEQLIENHLMAMSAENVIGTLLEAYIAEVLKKKGWVWCSGKIIKHVDFLKFSSTPNSRPIGLQIKNRSNSENSSSAAIRKGTDIQKWYRINAKTGETKWQNFPDPVARKLLSEDGFRKFVSKQILTWKNTAS